MILNPFEHMDPETCSTDWQASLFFLGFIAFPLAYMIIHYCSLCLVRVPNEIYFFYRANFTQPPQEASEIVPEETIKEFEDL